MQIPRLFREWPKETLQCVAPTNLGYSNVDTYRILEVCKKYMPQNVLTITLPCLLKGT